MFGLLRRVLIALLAVVLLSPLTVPVGAQELAEEAVEPPEDRPPVPEAGPDGATLAEESGPRVEVPLPGGSVPPGANGAERRSPARPGEAPEVDDVRASDVAELARAGLVPAEGEVGLGSRRAAAAGVPLEVVAGEGDVGRGRSVRLEVLDRVLMDQVSPVGAAVALDVRSGPDRVRLDDPFVAEFSLADVSLVDQASLWERLELVWLSDCHVSSDTERVSCGSRQALPTEIDRSGRMLRADVDMRGLAQAEERRRVGLERSGVPRREVRPDVGREVERKPEGEIRGKRPATPPGLVGGGDGGFEMLAVGVAALGPSGSFAASPFPALADFQVGQFTGSAETAIPIAVPPAAAGVTPSVRLAYSSGSIDGMHTNTTNQSGPVGLGWSLVTGGSIIEHFEGCQLTQAPNEVCEDSGGRHFSIVLDGRSSELRLVPGTTNDYRLLNEPLWKVERLTSAQVGSLDTEDEYWRVQTPDGTQYPRGVQTSPYETRSAVKMASLRSWT